MVSVSFLFELWSLFQNTNCFFAFAFGGNYQYLPIQAKSWEWRKCCWKWCPQMKIVHLYVSCMHNSSGAQRAWPDTGWSVSCSSLIRVSHRWMRETVWTQQLYSHLLGLGTLKRLGKLFLMPVENTCSGLCSQRLSPLCFLVSATALVGVPLGEKSKRNWGMLLDLCEPEALPLQPREQMNMNKMCWYPT